MIKRCKIYTKIKKIGAFHLSGVYFIKIKIAEGEVTKKRILQSYALFILLQVHILRKKVFNKQRNR